ncbi:uncharacterized protein LOC117939660 [Etheostoma cragini]|uniref:uncharacterized protein LOC117939660 n=1 Tax=Etheostoma cragini TaxID=417921 RepID=UPI00155E3427|nr:uncharacterized protein LOC117939660 [Etheostoma cragini]
MGQLTLCYVLLLPLGLGFDSEVTLVKSIGREPDVTPLCNDTTPSHITLVVCKIRTEMSGGEECLLLYRYGRDIDNNCSSRFTLMRLNQNMVLHLTSLTPGDSGTHTCECAHPGGTDILHLNITVEEDVDADTSTQMLISSSLMGVTIIITITAVIFGCIYRRVRHGRQPQPLSSHLKQDEDDPYTSLQQPVSDLYQTISNCRQGKIATVRLDDQDVDGEETDPCCEIYENIVFNES